MAQVPGEQQQVAQAQAAPQDSLAAMRARYGPRYRWILLASVMVGTMASIMSSTIVNVAIPDMSQHFTLGQERAQWVSSGFMVASTVGMLTTPWMLARFGYRARFEGIGTDHEVHGPPTQMAVFSR